MLKPIQIPGTVTCPSVRVLTDQNTKFKASQWIFDSRSMWFSPPVFHSGSPHVFSHADSERRNQSDAFFGSSYYFFLLRKLYFIFLFISILIFLYILLYIETPCTIFILQKRYAHGTFAAERAYLPTPEKKDLGS